MPRSRTIGRDGPEPSVSTAGARTLRRSPLQTVVRPLTAREKNANTMNTVPLGAQSIQYLTIDGLRELYRHPADSPGSGYFNAFTFETD